MLISTWGWSVPYWNASIYESVWNKTGTDLWSLYNTVAQLQHFSSYSHLLLEASKDLWFHFYDRRVSLATILNNSVYYAHYCMLGCLQWACLQLITSLPWVARPHHREERGAHMWSLESHSSLCTIVLGLCSSFSSITASLSPVKAANWWQILSSCKSNCLQMTNVAVHASLERNDCIKGRLVHKALVHTAIWIMAQHRKSFVQWAVSAELHYSVWTCSHTAACRCLLQWKAAWPCLCEEPDVISLLMRC